MVKTCREPIFAKENGHMGSMIRYDGLGYKVGLEKNSKGDITDGQLTILDFYLTQVHRQIDYIDSTNNNENIVNNIDEEEIYTDGTMEKLQLDIKEQAEEYFNK